MEPCLGEKRLKELELYTTPCLSLFGIYIHVPTGLLIVYCRDRQSFTIRKTRYELQDVINRTMRNDIWTKGEAEVEVHYVRWKELSQLKVLTKLSLGYEHGSVCTQCEHMPPSSPVEVSGGKEGFPRIGWEELLQDIETQEKRLGIKVPEEVSGEQLNDFNRAIPLLPVYVGYISKKARFDGILIHTVDLSSSDYKEVLKRYLGGLLLLQNIYSAIEKLKVPVAVYDGKSESRLPSIDYPLREFTASDENTNLKQFIVAWYRNDSGSIESISSDSEDTWKFREALEGVRKKGEKPSKPEQEENDLDIFYANMNGECMVLPSKNEEVNDSSAGSQSSADLERYYHGMPDKLVESRAVDS
ncbi:DEKNAAC100430 [Brettanomyces naardenensis]|uniref:DEKNAAC100430 n=1 Tax=Brettanomyces naardenensis TaxID=13370 RepID=A0A448YGI1_BRENA|nr:DEKNAAC100430 [Brettanomyces naardenensis]